MSKTTETKIQPFLYQSREIHFLVNPSKKDVMINATEMAKMFGKRTGDYLANKQTKILIERLERTLIGVHSDYKIREDRGHAGMYFCEILALDFAAWLDVDFKIWIYSTIKEVLNQGAKKVKDAANALKDKEIKLSTLIQEAKDTNNIAAIKILEAMQEVEEAKKGKTKAVSQFSRQITLGV